MPLGKASMKRKAEVQGKKKGKAKAKAAALVKTETPDEANTEWPADGNWAEAVEMEWEWKNLPSL